MRQKQQRPAMNYRVDWIGQDPNFLFSKKFSNGKEASELASKNAEAVAYKLTKESDGSSKWQIIPTPGSKELVRTVKLNRKIREKRGLSVYLNADGIGENEVVSTTEYRANQKIRIASTLLVSGALVYAGYKTESTPWLRYTFFGVAALNAFFHMRNYNINKNV